MSLTLGISAFYHDSAAALLRDDEIVAAVQEERFSRVKFDARFPHESIRYCLKSAGCRLADLDRIVFYDKPFDKFDRLLETYLRFAPRGFTSFRKAMPVWMKQKLFLKQHLLEEFAVLEPEVDVRAKLRFSEHHLSHAASAFYPSPFREAAVLVLDGVGEWSTATLFHGRDRSLSAVKEIRFPHSLGLLYSAFTAYCGFKVNSGEYKLMGLAPYGEARFADKIKAKLVQVFDDGSFHLNMKYFAYCTEERMFNSEFEKFCEGPARALDGPMERRFMDWAASIQSVTEEIMLKIARQAAKDIPSRHLCLAGGVALNCVANGKILRDGAFEKIWIQPAAGDAGGALGAAYVSYFSRGASRRVGADDLMQGALLGPAYDNENIERTLKSVGAVYAKHAEAELINKTAELLAAGMAGGWFQGRMEFGPRALGSRSILADARRPNMQSELNLKIKFRESFRPFAPAVLREDVGDWFSLDRESPYMLLVADVIRFDGELSQIPAVTHVDRSARVQTVHLETQPRFHALLSAFKARTGCPVLVNTSFNVRGEPLVNTPAEAWRCFMGTNLDFLVIGDFMLLKSDQPAGLKQTYHEALEKD